MPRIRPVPALLPACLLLALAGVAGQPSASAQPPAPDLKKLRVLLVIDSDSDIGKSVSIDQASMEGVLADGIPRDRYEVSVFSGAKANPREVLAYFRKVPKSPDEGLLFFYAGHGATRGDKHTLTMRAGELARADLLAAMKQKNPNSQLEPGLVVVLTDCCSTVVPAERSPSRLRDLAAATGDLDEVKTIRPVLRCLLFQHRGVVDITAATADASMGDDEGGGYFTRSLRKQLAKKNLDGLDDDRDGFLTWKEFFPKVRDETDKVCQKYASDVRARGGRPLIEKQVPLAFVLPSGQPPSGPQAALTPPWRFGARVFNTPGGDGVLVREVLANSPAQKWGLETGVVITAIDGKPVRSEDDYKVAIDNSNGTINLDVRDVKTKKTIKIENVQLEALR
jgi:hypothetical protein